MLLFIYRLIINFIFLLSPFIILYRIFINKEDPKRYKEKLCFFSKKKIGKKLIWFHGASVGEISSIIPLVFKLEENKKIDQILITSSTLSSANVLKKFKFKKTIHQFYPIDTNHISKKFLDYWSPSLAIFIDSEIWPNMLLNLKEKKIHSILLNARMTNKSFNNWIYFRNFAQKIFQCFDITFPQNKETLRYLRVLNVKKIKFLGNIKFSENEIQLDNNINLKVRKFLKNKKYWCASSTHDNEEVICAKAHIKLKEKIKNLITIIIPRHTNRTPEITSTLRNLNLKVHCHSSNETIKKNTDIYIVDTYGETVSFFKICNVVFLGGSLINHGGQNPIEAARNGCKIIYGPNIRNFKEVYKLLDKNKVSNKVRNEEQLARKVNILIKSNKISKKLENKINKLGKKILENVLSEFKVYLDKI